MRGYGLENAIRWYAPVGTFLGSSSALIVVFIHFTANNGKFYFLAITALGKGEGKRGEGEWGEGGGGGGEAFTTWRTLVSPQIPSQMAYFESASNSQNKLWHNIITYY
jgi:hypothetical protein